MREKSYKCFIPIYEVDFEIVVCDDIPKSRNTKARLKYLNGEFEGACRGLCSHHFTNRGRLYMTLFFQSSAINHNLIAHEVRHAVDDILHRRGVNADPAHCFETTACLSGHISELVYSSLRKWKIRIK